MPPETTFPIRPAPAPAPPVPGPIPWIPADRHRGAAPLDTPALGRAGCAGDASSPGAAFEKELQNHGDFSGQGVLDGEQAAPPRLAGAGDDPAYRP